MIKSEEQKENNNEESLWDLCDTMKRNNIPIMGIPEGEKKGIEIIFKVITAENALNLGRQMNKIHEAPLNPK